jgi:predicted Zn-dependent protease
MCDIHNRVEASGVVAPLQGIHRRDMVRGLWAGTMVLGVSGCASVAEVFAPSDDDLLAMSAQAWQETKSQTPISTDAKANKRLQAVGPRIAKAANRPNDAWEFVVFDSPEKNAWVLPGGKVGFYKGLMDFCDTDDMVACVLGHEVGHVTARHAALRAGQQTATNLALQAGGAALGSTVKLSSDQLNMAMAVAGAGAQVGIFLPFSRDNESEADRLGVDYAHSAGYDSRQAVKLWEKMKAAETSKPTEWMSTHPSSETRIKDLKAYINAKAWYPAI